MADNQQTNAPTPDDKKTAKTDTAAAANEVKGNRAIKLEGGNLGLLNDVSISLTIEVGRAQIKIRDLLNLSKGSIIELDKAAGDPVDIYANGKLISIGNIITANGKYCVRLISIPESNQMGIDINDK